MFCGQENRRCIARRDARKSWRHAEARCVKLRRRPLCVQVLATAAPHMLSRTALFRAASATWTWELTKNANERQRRPRKRFAVVADQADWI